VRLRFDLEFELRTVETDIETASRSVALLLIGGQSLGQDRGRAIRVVRRWQVIGFARLTGKDFLGAFKFLRCKPT